MYEHHAYVYSGTDVDVAPKRVRKPGTDVEHIFAERLSLEQARSLRHLAERRPQSRETYEIVLVVESFPVEAQNTLLKLFEDPPPATCFHLVLPSAAVLIPTLRSRVLLITNEEDVQQPEKSSTFHDFVAASYSERLQRIDKAHKAKQTEWFTDFFHGLELHLSENNSVLTVSKRKLLFQAVLFCKAPGASPKMLAESVALTLT